MSCSMSVRQFFFALALAGAASPQDGDHRKEYEARAGDLRRQAGALHVELGRWLEKEGQGAWAKYQYEWALSACPGCAEAAEALGRADAKWENRHSRFEDVDKALVKAKVDENVLREPQKGHFVAEIACGFVHDSKRPLYVTFTVRNKVDGHLYGRSLTIRTEKSPAGFHLPICWDDPDNYDHFKQVPIKSLECIVLRVSVEDIVFHRVVTEVPRKFNLLGARVGSAYEKLSLDCKGWGLNDESALCARTSIVYNRDSAEVRKFLGFTKVDYEFGIDRHAFKDHNQQLTAPPRWSSKEEVQLRCLVYETADKEEPGPTIQHEGNPGRSSQSYIVYRSGAGTAFQVDRTITLVKAWVRLFNTWLGTKENIYSHLGSTPYTLLCACEARVGFPSLELAQREELSSNLNLIMSDGISCLFTGGGKLFVFSSNEYKEGRGKWSGYGMMMVFARLLTGFSSHVLDGPGTVSGGFQVDGDKFSDEYVVWGDRVRELVTVGNYSKASEIFGKPANTLSTNEGLVLWSLFNFLILENSDKFWAFLKEFARNKEDRTGLASFRKIFGWELDEFERRWRQYVMENY